MSSLDTAHWPPHLPRVAVHDDMKAPFVLSTARRGAARVLPGIEAAMLGLVQATEHASAWRDLATRALERNGFMEADFALAAARHLREGHRPVFVFLWDSTLPKGDPGALIGAFPLAMPRFSLAALTVRAWQHPHAVLGTPLVDADKAGTALTAFFDWVTGAMPSAGSVLFPDIDEDGPFAAILRGHCLQRGRAITRLDPRQRAALTSRATTTGGLASLPAKGAKELRRKERRLAEQGPVTVQTATTPTAIRDACEIFLAMEADGWKGRARTAFLSSTSGAAFLRAATRSMADRGTCRIEIMRCGDVPVAAAILLQGGDRALYWKTTFNEEFAAFSPGVQLTVAISQRQLADPSVALTDSCAIPDHPMIDRLWPDRIAIADWQVALRAQPSTALAASLASERLRRRLRETVKRLVRSFARV